MSPDPRIVFGTDGWRGVIADTFTFANVRRVAQAVAGYIASRTASPKGVVIGFDNRFQGASFAREVAEVMLGNGIPVCLCAEPMPTPAISFATRHHGLDGGVMITASHNPAEYNGLKFKTPQGASADPTVTGVFEATLEGSLEMPWMKRGRNGPTMLPAIWSAATTARRAQRTFELPTKT